jgi:hypothetical protein
MIDPSHSACYMRPRYVRGTSVAGQGLVIAVLLLAAVTAIFSLEQQGKGFQGNTSSVMLSHLRLVQQQQQKPTDSAALSNALSPTNSATTRVQEFKDSFILKDVKSQAKGSFSTPSPARTTLSSSTVSTQLDITPTRSLKALKRMSVFRSHRADTTPATSSSRMSLSPPTPLSPQATDLVNWIRSKARTAEVPQGSPPSFRTRTAAAPQCRGAACGERGSSDNKRLSVSKSSNSRSRARRRHSWDYRLRPHRYDLQTR